MLASGVCRRSGWGGRDHSTSRGWGAGGAHCLLSAYEEGSLKLSFLCRPSGEPTIPQGTIGLKVWGPRRIC